MAAEQTTILVIDDDDAVRQSIADVLEDLGFQIVTAENGRIGIERFRPEIVDLVLVDLRMPEMDGLQVLAHINQKSPDTPLIVVSGTGVITDAVEALHQGAWDYILKPIEDFSILFHAIETNLEKARLKRENRQYQLHLEQMVTERTAELKQANESLRESEQQLRSILDNIRAGVMIFDVNTKRVLYANPSAAEMAGSSVKEMIGCVCHEILCPDEEDHCPVLDLGQDVDLSECMLKTRSGKELPILKTVTRTRFQGKECLLESFIDLTAQKAAAVEKETLEKQLRKVQRMEAIGTLAGGIAHDFNNILSIILGATELAIMEASENQQDTKMMRKVLEAGNRATGLVQQILTISRQRELEKKPLLVSLIVKDVIKMLRATLPTTIEISQEIDSDTGMALADPALVHQIMMNLTTNAAHAMRDTGGVLEIKLKNIELDNSAAGKEDILDNDLDSGAYLKLTVNDTGHGMDQATIERIFDPYFTTKSHEDGTGLGLAVVMGIVKGYGGSVSVHSEIGKGTRFDVLFPRVDNEGQTLKPTPPAGKLPSGEERILLIDDEELLVNVARDMLKKLGYRVHVESESLEALRRFTEDPRQFDLVISDVTMPKMPGDELAREMLQIRPDIPIILCTGFTTRISENEAKAMGIRALIGKPLQLGDLAITVRKALTGVDSQPKGV